MKYKLALLLALACLVSMWPLAAPAAAQDQQKPTVKIPEPGVPQVTSLEGMYVRVAYNNEGYAIIGYRAANQSVGDEWILLELGATLRDGVPTYTMTRDKLSLDTPDGQTIPLPSVTDYRKADLRALEQRAAMIRDSINYFPPSASQACRIGFFSSVSGPAMPYDQVELTPRRACLGRVYFQVPGGIKYGQYWLNVKFDKSLVRVPFRILTKDEEKLLSKNYKDIEKQVKAAFQPKKK
jgi:hypothetical protein